MLLAQASSRATSRSADGRLFGGSRAVRWLSALRLVGLMQAFLSMAVRLHFSLTPLAPRATSRFRSLCLFERRPLHRHRYRAVGREALLTLSNLIPTNFLRRTCPQFADCSRLNRYPQASEMHVLPPRAQSQEPRCHASNMRESVIVAQLVSGQVTADELRCGFRRLPYV
jgi:hypothetical protein